MDDIRPSLKLFPIKTRTHKVRVDDVLTSTVDYPYTWKPVLPSIQASKYTILTCGAHVIKEGCSLLLIDLIEAGQIDHIAVNGAFMIHDYELSRFGGTSEDVQKYITHGQFGMWEETSQLNDVINGTQFPNGLGERVGQHILTSNHPYNHLSVLAAAYQYKIPLTVHVSLGQDILHQHPNFNPEVTAKASYHDFLTFVNSVSQLHQGVLINAGSAVMGPEIFLKALSMVRNTKPLTDFTTIVTDLHDLTGDPQQEPKEYTPEYYFRPWKSLLVRTVKDGGKSHYVRSSHRETFSALYSIPVEVGGFYADHTRKEDLGTHRPHPGPGNSTEGSPGEGRPTGD